ncbi:MAG: alpha-amylase family glycosyl hydrolase [Ilumatobacter sp.]|uniref:alpha-amylase family glycosyl hydrolase n=1 Tax=Ilumatobacter sp. TaxID=1967498 RepID=UPI0026392A8F|nr:alpha-amylase family glycosyl hydrolase [Ilumatobacter sp.]MDJ0771131.1 alpha-amylase family glycosyl hydrolase [Ilumatobacter sp.]
MRRPLAACVAASLALAACSSGDDETQVIDDVATVPSTTPTTAGAPADTPATADATIAPAATAPPTTEPPVGGPVLPEPLRSPLADDVIYMVMTDRFANGDPSNDLGGDAEGGASDDDILRHGFDPTRTGYYHGGDIAGLAGRLDYLQGLGITAIWLTPVLRNKPVQGDGTIDGSSAGYHGYWQLDFTQIDPHLGTEEEFLAFVDAAHDRDMKVIVDVVVNHTADVISYGDQSTRYEPVALVPYLDADGDEFDVRALAGSPEFPDLDPAISFPLVPSVAPGDEDAKAPAFLNDLTNYHHRGESTFFGETSLYGDFVGLDDLFTEKPEVVEGMIDVFGELITRFGVDGFRVDTAKHVNDEFWQEWLPGMRDVGGPDFAIFGEVVEPDPDVLSRYVSDVPFPSVIDMRMDDAIERFAAQGAATDELAGMFAGDDWFTDADSNAHQLVTVISSHDFGRLGGAIDRAARRDPRSEEERFARMRLGLAAQFLSRGTPIVYYGDEQGFAGVGGDQAVREDMFPSLTPQYAAGDNIGSEATPADDNFDPSHPLYTVIAELAALRADAEALRTGAQTVVWSQPEAGLIAWTRRGADGVEHLVALNNSDQPASASIATLTPDSSFTARYGDVDGELLSDADGRVDVGLPPFGVGVWVGGAPAAVLEGPAGLSIEAIPNASFLGRDLGFRLAGELRAPVDVVFDLSTDGGQTWSLLGVDDAAPYVVYTDLDDVVGDLIVRASVWVGDDLIGSVDRAIV